MTADLRGEFSGVAFKEPVQRELIRAIRYGLPRELGTHRLLHESELLTIASEKVQARTESVNAMHKEHQVDGRIMGPGIPGHRTSRLRQLRSRHDPSEHVKERRGG